MESFTSILLHFTWMFALITIAGSVAYFSIQSVKNMRDKRAIDNEIYDIIKTLSSEISQLKSDVDNLGKKLRAIEKR